MIYLAYNLNSIVPMFVRTKTTPKSPRNSVQVVENIRDSATGKVKQKILRHVGIAFDEIEEEKLKQLALELIAKITLEREENSKQLSLFASASPDDIKAAVVKKGRKAKKSIADVLPVDQVTIDMIEEEHRVIDGVHEVCGHLYDLLKFDNISDNNKYRKILKDLVLCRISNPSSKLATSKALRRYYDREHDLDAIYRTMDHIYNRIDDIKTKAFDATLRLIPGKVDLVLFDVTTLYFESVEVDELRKFGYSKDFRFNSTQVVLALASNSDGLPIGYELFEGNKAEVKTLIESIEKWKKQFDINQVCFIGDRAMFCEGNLKEMEDKGYQYIVAAKLKTLHSAMIEKIQNQIGRAHV